jgi:lectin, mannose-binding 2
VPTKALLTYFADQNLTLALQYKNEDEWTPCFSIPSLKIPSVAYLGFSAETGELSDNHDLISVETRNMYQAAGTPQQGGKGGSRKGRGRKSGNASESSSGGWGWFFFKFIMFGMVVAGSYVGYTMYRANKRPRY